MSDNVSDLGMGDVFTFEEHAEQHTVREASISADGTLIRLDYANGGHDVSATVRRVFLIERAPNCPCGARYEHCGNECVWPDALWKAAGF